jgi:hypothetical protein
MQKFGLANDLTKRSSLDSILHIFKELLDESYKKNIKIPWQGGHDEGTYLTAFREYFLHTKDPIVKEYAISMLQQAFQWIQSKFPHGYYPYHEVHHGIENFVIFFAWLYEIDPLNVQVKQILRNAASNIVHPPNNLAWFNSQANRFTSTYLGTDRIDPNLTLNIAEHTRMIRLAWLGSACGGEQELKTVILNYMTEWAEIIKESEQIPVWLPEKKGPNMTDAEQKSFQLVLQKFMGAAPKEINNSTRSEFHIANGTPDLFISLYESTKNLLFLDAVEKILTPVIDQLASPFAHPLGEIFWHVHQLGKFPNLMEDLHDVKEYVDELLDKSYQLKFRNFKPEETKIHRKSIGFRPDMPNVEVKSSKKRYLIPSPSTLGLLYRLTGSDDYLIFGLEYSRAILQEAQKKFPEGRDHGCSSRMLHSFCIGHGRDWGAGFTSTILRAALSRDCYNIALPKILLK